MDNNHFKYMRRCIEIASKEIGNTYPNPLVGCVIVYKNKIIGEGSHKKYGHNHAEVEAVNNVKNKSLLKDSTLYVNLEPCNHYGKTPPCSEMILENKIENVIVGSKDPNEKVNGGGIDFLINKGLNVEYGILEKECRNLNKRFYKFHESRRPYIILKWSESKDNFISPFTQNEKKENYWISSNESKKLSHSFRKEEHSILVGVQTVIDDDPRLSTRLVSGKNPIRIILDPNGRIPKKSVLFKEEGKTIVISKHLNNKINDYCKVISDFNLDKILSFLYEINIQSILVEGGARTISEFLKHDLWDSIRVFKSEKNLQKGIRSPNISLDEFESRAIGSDILYEKHRY